MNPSKNHFRPLFSFWLSTVFLIWIIRAIEFIQFPNALINYSFSYFFQGLFFDLWFICISLFIITIIQFGFALFLKKYAVWIFHAAALSLILIHFGLSQYFILMQMPLDSSIYFLSWNDLTAVINIKNYLDFFTVFCAISGFALYFIIGSKLKSIQPKTKYLTIICLLSLAFVSSSIYVSKKPEKTICMNNHVNFFIQESLDYYKNQRNISNDFKLIDINSFAKIDENFFPFDRDNSTFPLMHNLKENPKLNTYFNLKKNNPPNIVIILVESLNSYFVSDEQNIRIEIMPFLKSLSKQSLFFPNTISTCERTLNVLPSTLASLPVASDNILATAINPMPLHFSLPSLLKKHYYSSFYCGVDLSFTNMNGFLNYNQIDYLSNNWDHSFNKINNEFYSDAEIFRKNQIEKRKQKSKKNRLDIFLTYNTHEPFNYSNKKEYTKKVKNIINQSNLSHRIKMLVLKNAEKFGSYYYLDDQLKKYFETAKKSADHNNTIYFIVGDHGSELCYFDAISRFHTSLIVYSPLLKNHQISREVVSHLDIVPSIIGLLKQYKQLNLPTYVPFAGKELVINKKYNSDRILPLKGNNLKISGVVNRNYYMDKGQLFSIDKNMNIKPLINDEIQTKYIYQLELYKKFSNYVFNQNQIVPFYHAEKYIHINKSFPFYFFTEKKSEIKFDTNPFINIGEIPVFPSKCSTVNIKIELEISCANLKSQEDLPDFVYGFTDKTKKENNILYYRGIKPKMKTKFSKKGLNSITYHTQIQLKDIPKIKKGLFYYYLYNPLEKRISINSYSIRVETDVK